MTDTFQTVLTAGVDDSRTKFLNSEVAVLLTDENGVRYQITPEVGGGLYIQVLSQGTRRVVVGMHTTDTLSVETLER